MYQITQITSDTWQTQTLNLPDATQIVIEMYYRPLQYGWFFNTITYGTFTVQGMRISVLPNMLYQFSNQLPFGISCVTSLGREPTQQNDFASGAFSLYVLTPTEMQQYAAFLSTGGVL